MARTQGKVPTYDQLMNPLIKALIALGGSGTIDEIYETVIEQEHIPDEVAEIPHAEKGNLTEIGYRLAWARTYLKKFGVIENSSRGVWTINRSTLTSNQVNSQEVVSFVRDQELKKKSEAETGNGEQHLPESEEPEEVQDWKEVAKKVLISMKPDAFERLVKRILRESGFMQVEVTGKVGDGGIDGKGIYRMGGMLSFHVMFQCKRYQGTVGSSEIRDFRGALQGRADKGIFITTGSFTREAQKEANRDGAPPIDLIDGNELMNKLKELKLGIKVEMVEKMEVDEKWFVEI